MLTGFWNRGNPTFTLVQRCCNPALRWRCTLHQKARFSARQRGSWNALHRFATFIVFISNYCLICGSGSFRTFPSRPGVVPHYRVVPRRLFCLPENQRTWILCSTGNYFRFANETDRILSVGLKPPAITITCWRAAVGAGVGVVG
jgi:hypothetical protein